MTLIRPDFAERQDRYRFARTFYRDILSPVLLPILAKITVTGLANVPATGPTLLMVNHIAAVDPLMVILKVRSRFAIPFSKIENLQIPIAKYFIRSWGVIPVKRGEVDRTALQASLGVLKRGYAMVLAPEGHRAPALQEAKEGLAYLATRTNSVIVPIGVEGTREFLPNLKRLRRTPMSLTFGKPFRFRTNGNERVPREEMSRMMQEAMYQLAALVREDRRGFYSDLSKTTTDTLEFVTPS